MSNDKIISYIKRTVALSDEEATLFSTYFKEKKIKKGQYIIQPDFIAKHRNYIIKGSFRAYVIDQKGHDHTISFAIEDWWISDVNSYIYQQPATMFVVAMEDSMILQIEYDQEKELKNIKHIYETFFRMMAEKSFAFLQRRIITNLTQSAEERYDDFMEKYPVIAQRMPQYVLASYLGMTTQFLSRIRKKKTMK